MGAWHSGGRAFLGGGHMFRDDSVYMDVVYKSMRLGGQGPRGASTRRKDLRTEPWDTLVFGVPEMRRNQPRRWRLSGRERVVSWRPEEVMT